MTVVCLINYHILPRIGGVRVETFTARAFTDFCRDVLETPPKIGNRELGPRRPLAEIDADALRKRKKTLNTLIGILRLALRMAWENGETDSDRAWRCLRQVPHADVPRQLFLTREQCRTLLAHCRADLARLVRGAIYTGCRVTELANLRVRDFDPKLRAVFIGPLKSSRGRYVHLPSEGLQFFEDICTDRNPDDRIFLMGSGKAWGGNHKHLFKAAVRSSGLPDAFVFHGLRHTYASQLVQAGTPLAIVARQLGHANVDTVSRTYGHLSCQAIEEELERRFEPVDTL